MAMTKRNDDREETGFSSTRGQNKWDPKRNKMRSGTQCRFCRNSVKYIDYKDVDTLQKLLTNRGKIYSLKRNFSIVNYIRSSRRLALLIPEELPDKEKV